ncbi:MAG: Xaa-Pro peptidase family protein [Thermogutta sp.]
MMTKHDPAYFNERREKLRRRMKREQLVGFLVSKPENVTYLTGFSGEDSYLLVTLDHAILISDSRFTEQIREECPGLEAYIRPGGVSLVQAAARLIKKAKLKMVGVEAGSLSVASFGKLQDAVNGVEFAKTENWIEEHRAIKDKEELQRIRTAVTIAQRAFQAVRATLRPDQSEKEVADLLDHQMRLLGARRSAFPTIVGVGPRAALPHVIPTSKKIGEDVFVLVDWGADEGWYKSDLTRVIPTGKIAPKFVKVYNTVLKAQKAAIEAIRPGVTAEDVDRAARQVIEEAGFGRLFGHGLGHGVGLEIHELPRLGPKVQTVLRPGMVVTVEPGIYIPNWGGVRLEDDVLITRDGHEVLTSLPKDLDEVATV